jgi:hypothetical protein
MRRPSERVLCDRISVADADKAVPETFANSTMRIGETTQQTNTTPTFFTSLAY